jgi:adenine-specific DNA-methyltransferase
MARAKKADKKVTRYTYDDIKEPRTPETGHTMLMDDDNQVVRVSMNNGWKQAINVGKLEDEPETVLIDMDPLIDPLLVWSGKKSTVDVPVLPLQRNEVVSESRIKQIIDRAAKRSAEKRGEGEQMSLTFHDLEKELRDSEREKRVEFYTHDEGWRNKLICGDSLHVMQSLLHYEGLRGKVQMTYIDPPYGIKYDSNFQQRVDSTSNGADDGADDVVTIKAFRDTWALGIHSYLGYLQERLYLSRELLSESGSVFVQINAENLAMVRLLMDEVFGRSNFIAMIGFQKTGSMQSTLLSTTVDYLVWYAKSKDSVKYYQLFAPRKQGHTSLDRYDQIELPDGSSRRLTAAEIRGEAPIPAGRRFRTTSLLSAGETQTDQAVSVAGRVYRPSAGCHWKTNPEALGRLYDMGRIVVEKTTITYKRYADDFDYVPLSDRWEGMQIGRARHYVVETAPSVVERCIAMSTDPGDLVMDITCGSGTTAASAELLGRRWITCDTSRVAVNVARNRLVSLVMPGYKLRGATVKEGIVHEPAARITLKSLAHGLEPETVEIRDCPVREAGVVRVVGPFEVDTLGRYSTDDWHGYVSEADGRLQDYVAVIARLYDRDASVDGASGFVHAVADRASGKLAISVGPMSGRVAAKQVAAAAEDAIAQGIVEVHILGWAFEANVGEIKSKLESRGKLKIVLVMIRPDTLMAGLKVTDAAGLFSPLALPEATCATVGTAEDGTPLFKVSLKGVGVFDRKTQAADFKAADSGYVSAWYLDEDYDGDCFVDCQMFFDFRKHPNLKSIVKEAVDGREFTMRYESEPFPLGDYGVCAVKVVDVYGNESTATLQLTSKA